ncbi:MAG: lysophospholipid acyltransferase family protein [Bauldia sp.]|nr:lysophospholipid acyltransferase family protein [Bauldia sp.]
MAFQDDRPATDTPRRKSVLGRAWKRFGGSPGVQGVIGSAAAGYIRLVGSTNRLVYEGSVDYATLDLTNPLIITMWHGQHLLVPAVRRADHRVVALISRHRDGEINAIAARKLGIGTIRGSAAREQSRIIERGGISGFLKLRAALREGTSVTLTADLSKTVARRAGIGVIQLARASGVPIAPIALATSRRINVRSWDRTSVNLPFGRMAMVVGDFIPVAPDADDAAMEVKRQALEAELNRITARAYALADRRNG